MGNFPQIDSPEIEFLANLLRNIVAKIVSHSPLATYNYSEWLARSQVLRYRYMLYDIILFYHLQYIGFVISHE